MTSAEIIPFRAKAAKTRPPTNDLALAFVQDARPDLDDAQILGMLDRIAIAWRTASAANPDAFRDIGVPSTPKSPVNDRCPPLPFVVPNLGPSPRSPRRKPKPSPCD